MVNFIAAVKLKDGSYGLRQDGTCGGCKECVLDFPFCLVCSALIDHYLYKDEDTLDPSQFYQWEKLP